MVEITCADLQTKAPPPAEATSVTFLKKLSSLCERKGKAKGSSFSGSLQVLQGRWASLATQNLCSMDSAELHSPEAASGTSTLGRSALLALDGCLWANAGCWPSALGPSLAVPCQKCAKEGLVCFQLSRALICTTKYLRTDA